MGLNIREILSAFMVLFAVIDIAGSIPIILDIKSKDGNVKSGLTSTVAFGILLAFFFIGEPLLGVFGVDIYSFAIAGALVLFFISLEMILGIPFFKSDNSSSASIVPIAFPLIAGAGSFTSLLALKAEYRDINILIALFLNMILVYVVIRNVSFIERILGKVGIAILRKLFGVIILAIAIKLFVTNTGLHLGHK
jgi:multiple antibiotic resistance protein